MLNFGGKLKTACDFQPICAIKNLKKYFATAKGMLHAVDNVSLTIEEGQTLGVVGESGCGKSTLGRTIIHLLEPTGGQLLFRGKDITKPNSSELRELRHVCCTAPLPQYLCYVSGTGRGVLQNRGYVCGAPASLHKGVVVCYPICRFGCAQEAYCHDGRDHLSHRLAARLPVCCPLCIPYRDMQRPAEG